jgi:arylsulfatase A-like enzyme
MVKRIDEAYGRLLEALTSLGVRDNTIVLFTSDHANHFKTRNSEYKRSVHDASIRVPTVATGGVFTGGGQVQQLISHVDLPPTLLDAAGLPVPEEMQGRSALPLLRDRAAAWPDDLFVQVSESETARAVRTRRWKYGVTAQTDGPAADRYEEACLYDLMADPDELDNLIGYESHLHVADRLRVRLVRRMAAAGEQVPTITHSPERPSGQRLIHPEEALS